MLFLTPKVLREISSVVRSYTGVVSLVAFGADAVSPEAVELATKLGIVDPKNPKPGLATLLHAFGAYTASVGREVSGKLSLDKFRALWTAGKVEQTREEKRSAEAVARRGAAAMANTTLRLTGRAQEAAEAADAAGYTDLRSAVRDVIAARFGDEEAEERVREGEEDEFFDGIFRSTIKRTASDIGHLTDEWDRDLGRIAQTEMTGAVHRGQAARWEEQEQESVDRGNPHRDVYVYKLLRPGHCRHCARLHADGPFPRVYAMSEVSGNSNVGRKVADWQFVIGPTHPFCACVLMRVPSFISMPPGWVSGDAAPSVIGPQGRLA